MGIGPGIDLLRDWYGTAEECKQKCIELGTECPGFIRVNSGSSYGYDGQCFFRSEALADPVKTSGDHDDRDCYQRVYGVEPVNVQSTSFFDFTVTLSMEDLMVITMVLLNVALVMVLCVKCKTKHVHPVKYTPVMVVGDSEMEELQK